MFESLRAQQDNSPFSNVWIELDSEGQRVVRDAGKYLRCDSEWLRERWPDMFHGRELWLDSEGVWRFRESQDRKLIAAAGSFTAYEKIPT